MSGASFLRPQSLNNFVLDHYQSGSRGWFRNKEEAYDGDSMIGGNDKLKKVQ